MSADLTQGTERAFFGYGIWIHHALDELVCVQGNVVEALIADTFFKIDWPEVGNPMAASNQLLCQLECGGVTAVLWEAEKSNVHEIPLLR